MKYDYAHGAKSAIAARNAYLQKIKWKKLEEQIIRDKYESFSDREIREKFLPHRTIGAVRAKRQGLGCHKSIQKHQIWTPQEIKVLKENYLNYDQRQLKLRFFPDKTIEQVRSAKMSRGLKKPPVWTNNERGLLIDHGANYTHRELQAKFFPDKNLSQISGMRKHLGVRRKQERR